MGQMDLSCLQTVQNEICQKCRVTISLVQVCFTIWIIFDRFEVIVKNLSQPLKFWANFGCFLRLSPQDGVRMILKLPDYSNYTRIHNSWKFGENRSSSFGEQMVNKKN